MAEYTLFNTDEIANVIATRVETLLKDRNGEKKERGMDNFARNIRVAERLLCLENRVRQLEDTVSELSDIIHNIDRNLDDRINRQITMRTSMNGRII